MGFLILTSSKIIMVKFDTNSTLKRLRNRYRLVVMNEDTYEEVVKFKLSRLSVYIILSSIFVLLTGLTVALIIFTPLKYYLPDVGYNNVKQIKEFRQLKYRTDLLEQEMKYKQQYFDDLLRTLKGNIPVPDTAVLNTTHLDSLIK